MSDIDIPVAGGRRLIYTNDGAWSRLGICGSSWNIVNGDNGHHPLCGLLDHIIETETDSENKSAALEALDVYH